MGRPRQCDRMPEFLELKPPYEALHLLLEQVTWQPGAEQVPASEACGRVTAAAVVALHPLPAFDRSAVDGYAVRAADTHGASESLPAYLEVVGEVAMGEPAGIALRSGECALIHTGGMLPEGADGVIMLEHTQTARQGQVEVLRSVAAGENVILQGEDVQAGEEVIPAGSRLKPAHIGGLAALGITRLAVVARPRVGILSSGDEVVPPEAEAKPGQVRDVNAYSLAALVLESGGAPVYYGIAPDDEGELLSRASAALAECDMLVITAGSSASARDLTAQVINQLGQPGVLVHGVNVRPGKPTILASCGGKAVLGLPGNPVSALVIASLFVTPVVEKMLGLRKLPFTASVHACLALNLPSQAGREDWVPVKLVATTEGVRAEPVFGKSNLIFTLARADGLVHIPADATGLESGALVEVRLI